MATTFRAPVFCAAGAAPSAAAALAVALLVVRFAAGDPADRAACAVPAALAVLAVLAVVAFAVLVADAAGASPAGSVPSAVGSTVGDFFAGVFFAVALLAGAARLAAGVEPGTAATSCVAVFFATMAAAPFHIL
ncbi:hypothetical protein [Streptomyces sp. NPDC054865]